MVDIAIFKGVGKHFVRGRERLDVLSDLNFNLKRQDFLALMGPSGSGKSTLLNLIGGIDQPSEGIVIVAGKQLQKLSSKQLAAWRARHIGFIFQFYHLMPVFTAIRNVELPLLLTKLSRKERQRKAIIALDLVGLSDRATHKPAELSGGEQQRVAIARALVADPDLLVCDEPTGDLDRDTANDILNLLGTLNKEHGKSIIMVTHDPKAAEHAQHIVYLDKGKLRMAEQEVS